MSKVITAAIWVIVSITLFVVAGLVAYQFGNNISYWLRVVWVELIFSLMIASSYLFINSSLDGKSTTVSNAVFASKCYGIGLISIYLCFRSYFFTSSLMQTLHIIVQVLLIAGLTLIFIGVKSIDIITGNQNNDENAKSIILNSYLERLNNLQTLSLDEGLTAKLQKLHDYFARNIKTINGSRQNTNLQKIDYILLCLENSPTNPEQIAKQIHELETIVHKFYVL